MKRTPIISIAMSDDEIMMAVSLESEQQIGIIWIGTLDKLFDPAFNFEAELQKTLVSF